MYFSPLLRISFYYALPTYCTRENALSVLRVYSGRNILGNYVIIIINSRYIWQANAELTQQREVTCGIVIAIWLAWRKFMVISVVAEFQLTLFTNDALLLATVNDPRANSPRVITRQCNYKKVTVFFFHYVFFVLSLSLSLSLSRRNFSLSFIITGLLKRIGSHKWGCKGRYVEQPAGRTWRVGIHFVIF